jgi:sugar phosphate isomerase/epimerase
MNPIGVMLNNLEPDRLKAFAVAVAEGFQVVHANAVHESLLTGPDRDKYIAAARDSGLTVASVFVGFDGQSYADFDSVAKTVGILAIPELREHRIQIAHLYSDLARELGVPSLAMHLGFFPKDPTHPDYQFLRKAVEKMAQKCADNGQSLHLETGQESAWELMQLIMEVDRPNLGVNFDCGNFLLYGTDEPIYALKILTPFVRGVHCKDGFRPTEPGKLGKEVPLGQGQMDFPQFIADLRDMNYRGPLIIERETGPNVKSEIQNGREFLEGLLSTAN